MSRFSWYIDSYLALSSGFMYQSKPSFRPGVSESSSTCSNCTCLPVRARPAWTRWDLDSGTSQSGRVLGTSAYSYAATRCQHAAAAARGCSGAPRRAERRATTDPVDDVEDDAHGDAELLKVQVAVVVDVGHVPHMFQLVVAQAAVLQQRRRHLARQVLAAIGPGREDVAVGIGLLGLDSGCQGGRWGGGAGSWKGARGQNGRRSSGSSSMNRIYEAGRLGEAHTINSRPRRVLLHLAIRYARRG